MPQELSDVPRSVPAKPERVVDLTQRRLQRLEQSIAETRARLEMLELKRFRTEIKTGRLRRELARHMHELKAFQSRLTRFEPAQDEN